MAEKDSIELLFSSQLQDYEAPVKEGLWTSIAAKFASKMEAKSSVENLFRNALFNYKVKPSAALWGKIASRLPGQAGLGLAFSSVSLLLMAFFMTTMLNSDGTNKSLLSSYYKSELPPNNQLVLATDTNSVEIEEIENKALLLAKNTELAEAKSLKDKKEIKPNAVQKKAETEVLITQKKPNISEPETIQDDVNQVNNTKYIAALTSEKQNFSSDEVSDIDHTDLKQPIERSLFIDTLIYYDTVAVYDTVRVTNRTEAQENNTSLSSISDKESHSDAALRCSLSPYVGFYKNTIEHSGSTKTGGEYAELYNEANSSHYTKSAGVLLNLEYKNWTISSGLAYLEYQEQFDYDYTSTEYKEKNKYNLKQNGFKSSIQKRLEKSIKTRKILRLDTISSKYEIKKYETEFFVAIDTLWTYRVDTFRTERKDTVYSVRYDTVRTAVYDTTYYKSTDTVRTVLDYSNMNKYTYLEIPIYLSYTFKLKKLKISPSFGMDIGLMLNAHGNGLSLKSRNEVYSLDDSELPFMNVQLSVNLGLNLAYSISPKLDVFVRPSYRQMLHSMYKESAIIDKKIKGFGLNVGLNYYFK